MYQSIPSLTIPPPPPRAKLPVNFSMGEFPTPEVQNPHPRGLVKRAKTPPPEAFFSIVHNKNMKKSDRNRVKLHNLSSLDH